MREIFAFAVVVLIGVAILALAALGHGCYHCADPACSNLPPVPPDYPPSPPFAATPCVTIGGALDVDSGVRDDAGVWHYRARSVSRPCDAGR